MLGLRLLSLHNVRYLHRLMERARAAIAAGAYGEFAREFASRRWPRGAPEWFADAMRRAGMW